MKLQDNFPLSPQTKKLIFACGSLFILLILIYGNSFEASWHFDDYPNIVANPNLHITDLSAKSISQGLYGKNGSTLFRPVAMLSFAMNYYFGEYNVWGYHLVNFTIHYITAVGLFLFIYLTLNLPLQQKRYAEIAYPVALIATIFWATNPVQVSAVTYIVQRMTSLAGLGYIYSMLFYLIARSTGTQKKYLYYSISAGMALLAFASKENSFMLPISLLLFDLFLFTGISRKTTLKTLFILALAALVIIGASAIYTDPLSILNGYESRPFSLGERLLTEPRIILFYLSLLFYPTSERLTLLHDIELSTSLFTPISTFWAITLIALIICFSIFSAKKRPLIPYCLIFFFINHLIEGTIIPLELIYEHRNYLPSMLIFLPLAILWVKTINYFSYSRILQTCFSLGLTILLISQSHTTTMRNRIFKDEISLWQDCVKKTPHLQRALINLGTAYSRDGQILRSISYQEKAMAAPHIPNKLPIKRSQLINANLGGSYYLQGDLKQAKKYYAKNINHNGDGPPKSLEGMALIMLQENRLNEAENTIEKALKAQPSNPALLVIYSEILLRKGSLQEAINKAKLGFKIDKTRYKSLLIIGLALRNQGRNRQAITYFRKLLLQSPLDIDCHLAIIEVAQATGNFPLRDKYVAEIIGLTGPELLAEFLNGFYSAFTTKAYSPENNIQLAFSETLQQYIHKQPTIKHK